MKLVFPKGGHPQALLAPGINRIGTAPDSTVVLHAPSMPAVAAVIHLVGPHTNLIPHPGAEILVNEKPVSELIALRDGDRIRIAGIEARLAAIATGSGEAGGSASPLEDPATRLIAAAPKHLLRCLNGDHFGRLYPVSGPMVIGRAPECDIILALSEISRRHAQLRPTPDGVLVEDLGSSNGVWINDQRIQRGILRPGDELRLDTNRFALTTPGAELAAASSRQAPPPKERRKILTWRTIMMVSAGALIIGAAIVRAVW